MNARECAAWLRQRDGFLLITHRNPDGDTVAGAAALCSALRRAGKRAYLYPNAQITAKLLPWAQPYFAPADFSPDCIVAVDVATEKMFAEGFAGRVDLSVDHHPSNSHYAAAECIDPERAACGEIVLEIVKALCGSVTKEEADLLYIALSTDCGCFQYANTDAHALRTAAELLDCGASNGPLNQTFFRRVSPARLKLEGLVYDSLRFYWGGEIVVALVTEEMLAQAGATEDDLDDLAGLPGRAEGHRVSILIRDWPGGESKVSVRSGPDFDSCGLCAVFGGGGHKMAAGCNLPVPPEAAAELLVAEAGRFFQ